LEVFDIENNGKLYKRSSSRWKRTTKDLLGQLELSPTTVNKWSTNINQLPIGMFTKKHKP